MKNEKLGFIGLGHMGHPMAKNLEKAGFSLSVYNRTEEKAEDFLQHSKVCKSIAELVGNSDVIFTMLTDDTAAKAVYGEILKENIAGKLFVEMSTISPEMCRELHDAVEIEEAAFLDAPVAGSTVPATEGTLIIMVGGEQNDLQRALPYLEKMGKKVKYVGKSGRGNAAKISINYFLSMIYQGLAETVLFSQRLGIEREDMLEIINESASGSGATKVKTPLLLNDDYTPSFTLDLMLKDIRLAHKAGANYPVGNAVLKSFEAASRDGWGKDDVIGIINDLKK